MNGQDDWQELIEWMHSPEVREAVARYAEPEPDDEEQESQPPLFTLETEQLRMEAI